MKNKDCKPSRICWQGFSEGECPLRRLENEKLFLSALLVIATGLVVWYTI